MPDHGEQQVLGRDEPPEHPARHAGGVQRAELDAAFGKVRGHRVVQQRDRHHDREQQHHADEDVHDLERVAQRRLERRVVEVRGRARQLPEPVRHHIAVDAAAELARAPPESIARPTAWLRWSSDV